MKKTKIKKQSLQTTLQTIPELKRRADGALQDYYRKKKLRCLACRRRADIVHHFIPQSQSAFLKYNEINLIPLCHSCHFRHHRTSDPTIHAAIIIQKGEVWLATIMAAKKKYLDINNRKFLEEKINYYEDNKN